MWSPFRPSTSPLFWIIGDAGIVPSARPPRKAPAAVVLSAFKSTSPQYSASTRDSSPISTRVCWSSVYSGAKTTEPVLRSVAHAEPRSTRREERGGTSSGDRGIEDPVNNKLHSSATPREPGTSRNLPQATTKQIPTPIYLILSQQNHCILRLLVELKEKPRVDHLEAETPSEVFVVLLCERPEHDALTLNLRVQ